MFESPLKLYEAQWSTSIMLSNIVSGDLVEYIMMDHNVMCGREASQPQALPHTESCLLSV